MLGAMRPTTSRAIAERARTQLGHITRHQLADLGLSDRSIRTLVAHGYQPVGRNTFRLPGLDGSFERRVMAACLDTGGVASHRTAARLHRLGQDLHAARIEVVVTRRLRRTDLPGVTVHSTTNLPPDDLVTVGAIPCVGVARTFMMLAALVPEVPADAIRTAIGDAARDGLVSDAWLWWRLDHLRCRGRNGVTAMEEILRRRQHLGATESWLEHTFLELIEAGGLPLPEVQRRIGRKGTFVARVDCEYVHHGLVIELEGYEAHKHRRAEDEARRRRLILAGKTVMVFTRDEVAFAPERVLADVAEALATLRAA
jgi:very-short-patch-repair endonuclease